MMEKAGILEYVLGGLEDRRTRFVFPFAVPADFWAREAALASGKALNPERFMAWDTFKEYALSVKQEGRREINRALRTLFASTLLRENYREFQKGKALLREYVNPDFAAASYNSFIGSIARLLPALDALLRRLEPAEQAEDAYFADLRLIHRRYTRFLDQHNLYEPAWNRAAFSAFEERWLLFYPELAEDWEDYAEELAALAENAGEVLRIIPLGALAPPSPEPEQAAALRRAAGAYTGNYLVFSSSAEEFRSLALIARRLVEEARLGYEDIAVSCAGGAPPERLIQEFQLFDLPINQHQGKSLLEYPAGRIFPALAACPAQKWSFRALKNLLLDKAFPWLEREWIDLLIEFGLHYRCLSGFRDAGREIDVWEKTFERHIKRTFHDQPVFAIERFYDRLKKNINAVVHASSFEDLRTAWRILSKEHFDEAVLSPEADVVFARSMRALEALIEIEKDFPGLAGGGGLEEKEAEGRAFPIFLSYLQDEMYVYQPEARGIALYNYRMAAGIGPAVHFIINMNQEDAAAVYTSGASFLREDRKRLLNIPDRDVSTEFIRAYALSGAFAVFTVSTQTFSGAAVPHRRLAELVGGPASARDLGLPESPYVVEAELAQSWAVDRTAPPPPHPLSFAAEAQKRGWRARRLALAGPRGPDLRYRPIGDPALRAGVESRLGAQLSLSRLRRRNAGAEEDHGENARPRFSPTDLNEYQACAFKWLLERGLLIEPKQTEIQTIDQRNVGMLYHRILEAVFIRIKDGDGRFYAARISGEYQAYIKEETDRAVTAAQMNEGVFQESVYAMLVPRLTVAAADCLALLEIDGMAVQGAELPLSRTYEQCGAILSGKADLVLRDGGGGLAVLDFKTSSLPKASDLAAGDEDEPAVPRDVQMAAYINMLETPAEAPAEDSVSAPRVSRARFYSIDNRVFRDVVGETGAKGAYRLPRPAEEYRREVSGVDALFARVAEAVKEGAYQVSRDSSACASCSVSSVCRRAFTAVSERL